MNPDPHIFWVAIIVFTVLIVAAEALLGYMKRSWYYKIGIPIPFKLAIIREREEIFATPVYYVRFVGNDEMVVRYRFLGNYSPSLLKVFVSYRNRTSINCCVTLNWWFVFLFSFSAIGAYWHGGLLVWLLFSAVAAVLLTAQLQGLRAFLTVPQMGPGYSEKKAKRRKRKEVWLRKRKGEKERRKGVWLQYCSFK